MRRLGFKVYHIVNPIITRNHAEGIGGSVSNRYAMDRGSRLSRKARADKQGLLSIARLSFLLLLLLLLNIFL